MKKVLFLVPYPINLSPSQRFRFEQYLSILHDKDYQYTIQSFLTAKNWKTMFQKGKVFDKALALTQGFVKRLVVIFIAPRYEFVFIHREATPIGPPVVEWVLTKVLKRRIIYDFDDAIWLTDRKKESFLLRTMKWRSKVRQICKWSYKISCGNEYLRHYATTYNRNAIHLPTTIDTVHRHNPDLYQGKTSERIYLGWTGSQSTLKYLYTIEPVLKKITEEYPQCELIVIADQQPTFSFSAWTFIEWNEKTEIEDLIKLDIGIMPLPDDEWTKGKCGFKALQYMALKVPAVVSPVGVNTSIVSHGKEGFFATNSEEWYGYISQLIADKDLRHQMGEHGRKKVIDHYSVLSNTSTFLSLFE